jgi:MFS transporter, DHA2 family, methylenomycin A resistance protein
VLPGTLAIISRTYPDSAEQARAIGIWAGVGSIALPAGPLLGGLLVQTLGWRWVFAINVPIVAMAGVIAARRIQPDRNKLGEPLDVTGTVLAALTLATLTFAVIEAGHSGVSSAVVVGLGFAVLAGLGFVAAELQAKAPMLPLGLFRRPAFSTANGVAAVMNFGTLGLLFLLTLYLQSIQQHTALLAGVAVLPLFLPLTVLAPIAGRVVGRHGPRVVMVIGLLVAAAGVALLATCTADSSYLSSLPALLGWGVGLGLLTPAVVAAAIAATPPDRSGLASGVNNTARQAGGAMGIAVYGAIAGGPANASRFLAGLHLTGMITAGLFVVGALISLFLISRQPSKNASLHLGRHER